MYKEKVIWQPSTICPRACDRTTVGSRASETRDIRQRE